MADSSVRGGSDAVPVDVRTAANGDARQVVVPGGDGDYIGSFTPYGHARVTLDGTSRFYDTFGSATLDTTATGPYTASNTAPTQAGSTLTFGGAIGTSYNLQTRRAFKMHSSQYEQANFTVQLEAAAGAGSGRFWGLGVIANSQSTTVLAQDGVGFEVLASDGSLRAVTYRAGVRTEVAALTRPPDGQYHRYSVVYRQSQTFWFIDGFTVAVAQMSYLDLAVTDLPLLLARTNGLTLLGAPVMVVQAMGLTDLSRLATQIGDGQDPGQLAGVTPEGFLRTVRPASNLAVSAVGTAGAALTATLPAVAAQTHLLTMIDVVAYNTAARTGTATPVTVTTTNLPGSLAFTFGSAGAIGAVEREDLVPGTPLRASTAGTATTIVAPATAGVLWRITVTYYLAT